MPKSDEPPEEKVAGQPDPQKPEAEKSEEVGYCKPPKKNQFPKGKSGNPKGRPKKEVFPVLLEDVLGQGVYVNIGGEKVYISKLEAFFQKLVNMSIQGDIEAMELLIYILKNLNKIHPV